MYQFQQQVRQGEEQRVNAKTITDLVQDETNGYPDIGDGMKDVKVTAGMSIWQVREAAGWPNYTGNVTDPYIINYLKTDPKYSTIWDNKTWTILKSATIKVPTYTSYLNNRTKIGGTAVIIYCSGKSSPVSVGGLGDGLKNNATKKAEILKKSGNYTDVILKECLTEAEFLAAVNMKYESGAISLLEVFSHGSDNSIVLGDRYTGEKKDYVNDNDAKDRRWFSRTDNIKGNKEILQIDKTNFRKDCRVILWGCRQAGGDAKEEREGRHGYDPVPVSGSFAKGLADHLRVPVQGFYNTSRIPEKTVNGEKVTYTPGYMSPEADAHIEIVMPEKKLPKK